MKNIVLKFILFMGIAGTAHGMLIKDLDANDFRKNIKELDKKIGKRYITIDQCPMVTKFIYDNREEKKLEKKLKKIKLIERFQLEKLSNNVNRIQLLNIFLQCTPNLVGEALENKNKQCEKNGVIKKIIRQLILIKDDRGKIDPKYTILTKLSNFALLTNVATYELEKEGEN
jgi:hypothetical protein